MEDAKDIDDVKIEMEALLAKEISPWTRDCCIYRVPHALRKLNEDAFTPTIVSIGPFHYGNPRLLSMERHKQVFFQRFIQRSQTNLDNLVDKVKELEKEIRHSYSEDIIKPEKKELIKLIVVDACFILELFLLFFYDEFTENYKALLFSCFHIHIGLDLILLENQPPFFVLEELFDLAFSSHQSGSLPSLLELTFRFFSHHNNLNLAPCDIIINNFTDLLRIFHLQPSSRRSEKFMEPPARLRYSVTKLREAGMKLMKDETECLLDLKFSRSHLRIPTLMLDEYTEILFRNMMALEQCHYLLDSDISYYVCMMNDLINNGNDVDVLVQNGIIINWLEDSNAVVKLFKGLATNIDIANWNTCYHDISIELNKFYENSRRIPWRTVASFAGTLLLLLTIIQTVFSILQVVMR